MGGALPAGTGFVAAPPPRPFSRYGARAPQGEGEGLRSAAIPAMGFGMQKGGGIILALCLLVGAGIGVHYGEGSLGIVAGLGVGLLAVVVLAWLDGRRGR